MLLFSDFCFFAKAWNQPCSKTKCKHPKHQSPRKDDTSASNRSSDEGSTSERIKEKDQAVINYYLDKLAKYKSGGLPRKARMTREELEPGGDEASTSRYFTGQEATEPRKPGKRGRPRKAQPVNMVEKKTTNDNMYKDIYSKNKKSSKRAAASGNSSSDDDIICVYQTSGKKRKLPKGAKTVHMSTIKVGTVAQKDFLAFGSQNPSQGQPNSQNPVDPKQAQRPILDIPITIPSVVSTQSQAIINSPVTPNRLTISQEPVTPHSATTSREATTPQRPVTVQGIRTHQGPTSNQGPVTPSGATTPMEPANFYGPAAVQGHITSGLCKLQVTPQGPKGPVKCPGSVTSKTTMTPRSMANQNVYAYMQENISTQSEDAEVESKRRRTSDDLMDKENTPATQNTGTTMNNDLSQKRGRPNVRYTYKKSVGTVNIRPMIPRPEYDAEPPQPVVKPNPQQQDAMNPLTKPIKSDTTDDGDNTENVDCIEMPYKKPEPVIIDLLDSDEEGVGNSTGSTKGEANKQANKSQDLLNNTTGFTDINDIMIKAEALMREHNVKGVDNGDVKMTDLILAACKVLNVNSAKAKGVVETMMQIMNKPGENDVISKDIVMPEEREVTIQPVLKPVHTEDDNGKSDTEADDDDEEEEEEEEEETQFIQIIPRPGMCDRKLNSMELVEMCINGFISGQKCRYNKYHWSLILKVCWASRYN